MGFEYGEKDGGVIGASGCRRREYICKVVGEQ